MAKDSLRKRGKSPRARSLLPTMLAIIGCVLVSGLLLLAGEVFSGTERTASLSMDVTGASVPIVGHLSFLSSGQVDNVSSRGECDGVAMFLKNIPPPKGNRSYYVWFLPDTSDKQGKALLLGRLSLQGESGSLQYTDVQHRNLLSLFSRLRITEQETAPVPAVPSSDPSTFRYYGELPQRGGADGKSTSILTQVRTILVDSPPQLAVNIRGGLALWFFQDTRKLLEWASAARGSLLPEDPALTRRQLTRITDYLNGGSGTSLRIPTGKQRAVPADPHAHLSLVPLLSSGGLVELVTAQLDDLAHAPQSSQDQRVLAGQLIVEIKNIGSLLQSMEQEVIQLRAMSDEGLRSERGAFALDDLLSHADDVYAGEADPDHVGAVQIHRQLLSLAAFPLVPVLPS